jgi:hypothetical protein
MTKKIKMGGSLAKCTTDLTGTDYAVATGKDTKAYKWYGMHVLSATCAADTDKTTFTPKLNIYGLIVLIMVVLMMCYLGYKMMGSKSDPNSMYGAGSV